MNKKVLISIICILLLFNGCASKNNTSSDNPESNMIVVGFSQVGAESEWRVANTENMRAVFSERRGYELIFDDARNKPENQIRAIRTFIQQDVDFIVVSPIVETGWNSILLEAKEADIPVIITDRYIENIDKSLYTAYVGSDFRKEGERAVSWLEELLIKQERTEDTIKIIHIQGTIGSSAQIGRTAALEQAIERNSNWEMAAQICGDFTRAKAYEDMRKLLQHTSDIDVVYCENDGEALGAIDALEEAGLTCNATDGVIVISFDATRLGLEYCLEGKIALNIECNPLQGAYVDEIIQKILNGESFEQETYIEETQFDSFTITQEMIEVRDY